MGTILDLTSGTQAVRKSTPSMAGTEPKPVSAEREAQQKSADRERLQEELRALRKREQLVLQTLAVLDHPELRAPIRELKTLLEASSTTRAQLAAQPSEAEQRELTALTQKLNGLQQQRATLDSQIEALEAECERVHEVRLRERRAEHARAVEQVLQVAGNYELAFAQAGISMHALFPELTELSDQQPNPELLSVLTEDIHDDEVIDALAPPASSTRSTLPPPLTPFQSTT